MMGKPVIIVQPSTNGKSLSEYQLLLPRWEPIVVATPSEALAQLKHTESAAVVISMTAQEKEAVDFLGAVSYQQPSVLRLVYADLSNPNSLLSLLGIAHQFLPKNNGAPALKAALEQASVMANWLPSAPARQLLRRMRQLPSPPQVYLETIKELQNPDGSLEKVGQIVTRDPALAAKLLQMANSSALGLQQALVSPSEAVMYLGFSTTRALLVMAHTLNSLSGFDAGLFSLDRLWDHSFRTARLAHSLARAEKLPFASVEESFTAGLLHDLGKLVLAANHAKRYAQITQHARSCAVPLWELEQKEFEANHADLGACLLSMWGLPANIVEAVALHHYPTCLVYHGFSPLTAVHVANSLVTQTSAGWEIHPIDLDYIRTLGLEHRVEEWKQIAVESEE